jgi:hypothetical protein
MEATEHCTNAQEQHRQQIPTHPLFAFVSASAVAQIRVAIATLSCMG